jgi:hypothetical protein
MIIDGKGFICRQLTASRKTKIRFANGQHTLITPARMTPCPDGCALALDGVWQVIRWPFQKPEADLVSAHASDANWETVQHGAVIRRRVAIPAAWKGKRIFLRFDALYPAGRVYLDGKFLGEHLSGLTCPYRLDRP